MFCPRAIYSYWREIWLERIPAPTVVPKDDGNSVGVIAAAAGVGEVQGQHHCELARGRRSANLHLPGARQ
jgi:hypothetical protein